MDFEYAENLSREEILQIFEQRHLNMNDIYNLTYEELVCVYKKYAMPLSRRPQRHKHSFNVRQNDRFDVEYEDEQMPVVGSNTAENMTMDVDSTPQINGCGNVKITPNPIGEKRRPDHEDLVDDYQYHLSRATKRIKINTMF